MATHRSYRDLAVWEKAMELDDQIYALTASWPDAERFGLTAQIRRAAVSIPSNIAEGHGHRLPRVFLRHLRIANGSLKEVETQLIIAGRQGFTSRDDTTPAWDLCQQVGRMLLSLMRAVRQRSDER